MNRVARVVARSMFVALMITMLLDSIARAQTPTAEGTGPVVAGVLIDATGHSIGSVGIVADASGMLSVTVIAAGLPAGQHGLHIHETGACDPVGEKPFTSAGAHVNPTGDHHGMHAGDLGNAEVDANGNLVVTTGNAQLTAAAVDLLADDDGSALVIHADPDDLVTDPSGNSGARIACAVLVQPSKSARAALVLAACGITPRSFDEVAAIFSGQATPTANTAEFTVQTGRAAGPLLTAQVQLTVRQIIDCINTGDLGRVAAHFTPSGLVSTFPWIGDELNVHPDEIRAAFDHPEPATAETWQTLIAVTDVVELPDGRLGAVIVVDNPEADSSGPQTLYLTFRLEPDTLLVDEVYSPTAGE